LVEVIITLVVAGPALGFLTTYAAPQNPVGFGLDLQAINSQLQQIFNGPNFEGSHSITIPVHNQWFFSATASLYLELVVNGQVLYNTGPSTVSLAPFQSGNLVLPFQISQALASQLAGKQITVGGALSFGAPSYLWNFNVTFPGS
jgi:hypothetical protein